MTKDVRRKFLFHFNGYLTSVSFEITCSSCRISTCSPRSHCKLLAASSSLPFSTRYDGVSGIKRVPKKSIDGATATSSALCRQFKYVPAMYDSKTPT